ncbi:MAG: NADH-quinone oxidoreductase subunit C [Patescibacteria group bacterium]|jgi:Ni,Fe-hydrogenase III large subunit/Ni,Fe-hydrogenase III component G
MNIEQLKKYIPSSVKIDVFGNAAVFETAVSEVCALAHNLRYDKNLQLKFITATDEREEHGCFRIWYVFGVPGEHAFIVPFISLKGTNEFPSLSADIHEAWNHERKIRTFFGLNPVGHPDDRPNILHENWPADVYPLRKDFDWQTRPETAIGTYEFQKVGGEGIYEIPVGPIHAGIIEPGHFRFSVAGEEIILLEPRLGYTHKGSEKIFETLSSTDMVRLSEKISGDSSFSHSLAFCQALEELSDVTVPKRAASLRVVYAELERLANHFGDIGAIMTDTGFNFGGAQGARLREMVMQINERLTGSRFLRGVSMCGGVTKDITDEAKKKLLQDLALIAKDFGEVIAVAENSDSLLNRLKGTGVLALQIALEHGATGVAARAVSIKTDARLDFPYAAYEGLGFKTVETEESGDVYARFYVRIKEARASLALIERTLQTLPEGPISLASTTPYKKNALAISVVEGWRGEIVYFVKTDERGNITRVALRDPSFMNWSLLGHAGAHNVVPDFPLINKSFSLSYTGNDL